MSDTSKQTQATREWRRLRAWDLAQETWSATRIAEALGVTLGAVSQWLKRGREGGREALRHRPPPGREPKLSPAQVEQLPEFLRRGPAAYGFRGALWTSKRVRIVIRREFGVLYHRAHVSRLLRQIGWTVQKPRVRATQRDEAAIARWKTERWPEVEKKSDGRGADDPLAG